MSATGLDRAAPQRASYLGRLRVNVTATVALLLRAPDRRPLRWPRAGTIIVGTVLALVAIAAPMLWLDSRAVAAVHQLPAWLLQGFDDITDFGKSGWFLWPIGLLLVAIALAGARELPKLTRLALAAMTLRLAFLFIAIGLPGLVGTLIKRVIGRARPLVVGDEVLAFKPFVWSADYASMPSGHGTTAFAAAVAIGALWPWTRPLMWTYAVLIALSRVAVTAHHPSDVIASAIFGALGALLVRHWFAARRLGFAAGSDGIVHRLPGPSFRRAKAVARRLLSA